MNESPSPPPRDADGNLLCQHCMTPVPPSLGTKPRTYCSRNCRQRAYEARRTRSIVKVAVAVALGRQGTSRDDARRTSRDVPKVQVRKPEPVAATLWEDPEIELRLARYGIGGDGQALDGGGEVPAEDAD